MRNLYLSGGDHPSWGLHAQGRVPMGAPHPTKGPTVQAPAFPSSDSTPTPLPVQPAPVQEAVQPVVELRPAIEPAAPAVPLAPVATAVSTVRVLARLSNGERIEVGAHDDESAAKAEATALMRFLREAGGDWPFLNGRFVRPDAIVSVDIVAG
jgi:hypothetical protein